jgi:hypothetical protein
MKANEFVKKFGWEKAKDVIKWSPSTATHFNQNPLGGHYAKEVLFGGEFQWAWFNTIVGAWYYDFNDDEYNQFPILDLKRLVDSYELIVKDFESVEIAEYEHMISGCYSDPYWIRIKQAIADVESCQ